MRGIVNIGRSTPNGFYLTATIISGGPREISVSRDTIHYSRLPRVVRPEINAVVGGRKRSCRKHTVDPTNTTRARLDRTCRKWSKAITRKNKSDNDGPGLRFSSFFHEIRPLTSGRLGTRTSVSRGQIPLFSRPLHEQTFPKLAVTVNGQAIRRVLFIVQKH